MSDITINAQPLIILGAGRSGTNILRDSLTQLPGVETWPCDEINYIWRHGNAQHPHDEFPRTFATPRVQAYIRSAFQRMGKRSQAAVLVEKTCANSLRAGFVQEILPEAKYVHIVRDGRDVVASALRRWSAPLEPVYLLRKARWVPLTDLPYYATRYIGNRIYRRISGAKRLAFWGPRFIGLEEALTSRTLDEVCAIQWKRCVDNTVRDCAGLPQDRLLTLTYEDLTTDKQRTLQRVFAFAGVEHTGEMLENITSQISSLSVGKWRHELTVACQSRIDAICASTLKQHGYT